MSDDTRAPTSDARPRKDDRGHDREAILREARTVAVLGAHPEEGKPAFYVPDYLDRQGYRMVPVNPEHQGVTLWGRTPAATLAELDEPIDVVVVFRRSEVVPGHVDDVLAMEPRPKVVWLQQGIRSEEAAERLEAEGIAVVQDACMLDDHRAFGVGPVG